MASEVRQKVSFLEHTLNNFIINTDKALNRLSKEMYEFKEEMKDFKDEMKAFKDEMREFKDEMSGFKNEMSDFKDEMSTFKEFVQADIEESRRERREMNKRWGEIAYKLGTFAEDIAAPNLPRLAKENFKEQEERYKAVRVRVQTPQDKDDIYEFDAIFETENKVFLLECKSTIRMEYINAIPELIENFNACFPQYAHKTLIPIFASMSIPDNIVKKLTKMGVYAMAMGDDFMDLLNFDALQKKHKS